MSPVRVLLPLVTFVLVSAIPAAAQNIQNFGTWQWFKGGGTEAIFTESTDAYGTFSLEVECDEGEPRVALGFLLASPADDIGLDPDRFAPDGQVFTRLDGEKVAKGDWSFSASSDVFTNDRPAPFLTALEAAHRLRVVAQDTHVNRVGTYSFDLQGAAAALDALSCYAAEAAG